MFERFRVSTHLPIGVDAMLGSSFIAFCTSHGVDLSVVVSTASGLSSGTASGDGQSVGHLQRASYYCTGQDGASSSTCLSSVSLDVVEPAMYSTGSDLVADVFNRRSTSGLNTSPFIDNFRTLRDIALLHGLSPFTCSDGKAAACAIIHHLMHGRCFQSTSNLCSRFTIGFTSVAEYQKHLEHVVCTSSNLSNDDLCFIVRSVGNKTVFKPNDLRRQLLASLRKFFHHNSHTPSGCWSISDTFRSFYRLDRQKLEDIACAHGISDAIYSGSVSDIRTMILRHFVDGLCTSYCGMIGEGLPSYPACSAVVSDYILNVSTGVVASEPPDPLSVLLFLTQRLSLAPLREVLTLLGLSFQVEESLSLLRNKVAAFIERKRGGVHDGSNECDDRLASVAADWPQLVSQDKKDRLLSDFKSCTSSEALAFITCASCGGSTLCSESITVNMGDVDLSLLRRPDIRLCAAGTTQIHFSNL
ncbi:hypothetical protein EV360DRAFT_90838 [Lentinula raphanica]|nr:hypothetical protein EV360DRAFT_90838 [Lentinula raphanica]